MNDDNSNRLTEINTYYTKIGIIVAIICAGVTIACTIISLRLDITWLLWVAGGLLILIVLLLIRIFSKKNEKITEERDDGGEACVSPSDMEDGACFKVVNKQKTISGQYYITLKNMCGYKATGVKVKSGNRDFRIMDENSIVNVPRNEKFTITFERTEYSAENEINIIVEWVNISACRQAEVIRIKESKF